MGNVGTIPATGYESSIDQTFSTPTGTTHTLTYSVASQADILVYVNNVPQEPGVGFTVSGTTLTTDNLQSGDTLYVKYLALARQTVAPAANSITESMMKDAFVDDFTDVTVTASDIILYGDATDSNNTKKDTVQGILDLVPSSGLQSYTTQFSVNVADATAEGTVTGVGFTPVCIIAHAYVSNDGRGSYGTAASTTTERCVITYDGAPGPGDYVNADTTWAKIANDGVNTNTFTLTSFDSDGITYQRTKNGTITGTALIIITFLG